MPRELRPPPRDYDMSHKFEYMDAHNIGGHGFFNAGVFIVRRKKDGKKYVEKKYKPEDIRNGTAAFEMKILRENSHKNIVEYFGGFIDEHSHRRPIASMYTEYCNEGNLDDLIRKKADVGRPFTENGVWEIFMQLTNALAWLQYGIRDACSHPEPPKPNWVGVLHRDIKPDNVFVCREPGQQLRRIVLGDFGQAYAMDDDGKWGRQYMDGNNATAPPEVLEGGLMAYTFAGDAYALGCTMTILCNLAMDIHLGFVARQNYSAYMVRAIDLLVQHDMSSRPRMDTFGRHLITWWEQGLASGPQHEARFEGRHHRRHRRPR
ncbi:MAG: hypothetical protein Q9200_004183 [Gallowayella weberi]